MSLSGCDYTHNRSDELFHGNCPECKRGASVPLRRKRNINGQIRRPVLLHCSNQCLCLASHTSPIRLAISKVRENQSITRKIKMPQLLG